MPNNPVINVSLISASVPVANTAQRILIVAQRGAGGSITDDSLVEDIQAGAASGFFGVRASLSKMIDAFQLSNPVSQIDAIGLDPGTTSRVHTITVTGTATSAVTIQLIVGSKKNDTISVPVSVAADANTIASAIRAAVNLDLSNPFVATGATADIILTAEAEAAGAAANAYPIGHTGPLPAGITLGYVETTPGGANPSTATTLDVIGTQRYQVMVWGEPMTLGSNDDAITFLDARFNATNGLIEDGVVIYSNFNVFATAQTENNAFNSQSAVPICYNKLSIATKYFGPNLAEHPDEVNAYFAGIITLRLTEGESIARFLTSTASGEQFGGTQAASLPLFNTPMSPIADPAEPDRDYTPTEIASLITSGGGVIGNNATETEVITGQIPTTYKTLPNAVADLTWHFLNYVQTGSAIRENYFNNLTAKYGQSRLTEGNVSPNVDMANEGTIRAFVVGRFEVLGGPDFLLVQKSAAATKAFKESLTITLDIATGDVVIAATFPIVTQLRSIDMTIKIAFSTEGG